MRAEYSRTGAGLHPARIRCQEARQSTGRPVPTPPVGPEERGVLRHDPRAAGEQDCLTTGPLAWGAFPFLGRNSQPPAFLAVALKLLAHCAGINDFVRRGGLRNVGVLAA
jgi:hypothetical protein